MSSILDFFFVASIDRLNIKGENVCMGKKATLFFFSLINQASRHWTKSLCITEIHTTCSSLAFSLILSLSNAFHFIHGKRVNEKSGKGRGAAARGR